MYIYITLETQTAVYFYRGPDLGDLIAGYGPAQHPILTEKKHVEFFANLY